MYKIIHGSNQQLADVNSFIHMLNKLHENPVAEARTLFESNAELFLSRAPGRLDVMGGIADYSGSLVLQLPIQEATIVALQRDRERKIKIVSLGADPNHRNPFFEMPLSDLAPAGKPIEYDRARSYFKRDVSTQWAAFVAGAFLVLMRERNINFSDGARILIHSDVLEGKGVSSSAAIEVAAMKAIVAGFGLGIEPRDIALLCQQVENLVVGAPCGVMDQMTAVFGEKNRFMALLCQPAELQAAVDIPDEITFWGIDSGERHSVSGSDYTSVRIGTFMGYRMIAELTGLKIDLHSNLHQVQITDPFWKGYLANISPSQFEQNYSARLPRRIIGSEFLSRYYGTTDSVTTIQSETEYAVRQPTAHPIYEHFRVQSFVELLKSPLSENKLELLGELMYQSHASYSACGLGSAGTDRLVQLVREAGTESGLYGAKITGGGSGGTVAILGKSSSDAVVQEIAEKYRREFGHQPYIFKESSAGANKFDYITLKA